MSVCALGQGGQEICVYPPLDRVSVTQRDWEDLSGFGIISNVALDDEATSFEPVATSTNGDGTTTDGGLMGQQSCVLLLSVFVSSLFLLL